MSRAVRWPRRVAPRLEIRIDTLVLDGVASRDRAAIAATLRRELTKRLEHEGRTMPTARARGRMTVAAPGVTARGRAGEKAVGAAVAGAVHDAVRR